MKNGAEDFMKAFQEYAEENNLDPENFELLKEFKDIYNKQVEERHQNLRDLSDWEKVDDYLEKAGNATSEKSAINYIKKALKIKPDCVDAMLMLNEFMDGSEEQLQDLENIIEIAKEQIDKDYFLNHKGSFWGIIETRPYMRALYKKAKLLCECKKMKLAAAVFGEIRKLNKNDNLGVRYSLMGIYVYLEDEKKALALYKQYPEESTPMYLYLAILYYKLGNQNKMKSYLHKLVKINPDVLRFFSDEISDEELDELMEGLDSGMYRPQSLQELIVYMNEFPDLFCSELLYTFEECLAQRN